MHVEVSEQHLLRRGRADASLRTLDRLFCAPLHLAGPCVAEYLPRAVGLPEDAVAGRQDHRDEQHSDPQPGQHEATSHDFPPGLTLPPGALGSLLEPHLRALHRPQTAPGTTLLHAQRPHSRQQLGYNSNMSWRPILWLALCGLLTPQTGMATTLLLQDRGTFAHSYVVESPEFSEDTQASEIRSLDDFDSVSTSAAQLPLGVATSSASLESKLGTETIEAHGLAASTLIISETGQLAENPADSFFEVVFEIERERPYRLRGRVDSTVFEGEGFASVELSYFGILPVVDHAAGGNNFSVFDESGVLAVGRYRLTAFALTQGEVRGDVSSPASQASFALNLTLPEPTLQTAGAFSLLVLARLARARRRAE